MHICIHTIIKYFHLCIKSVNELVSDIYRNCFLFIQLYIYDQIESFLFRIILYLYEINKLEYLYITLTSVVSILPLQNNTK